VRGIPVRHLLASLENPAESVTATGAWRPARIKCGWVHHPLRTERPAGATAPSAHAWSLGRPCL